MVYIPEEEITKEQVDKWLRSAHLREINVFQDHNKIIVLLCRTLLKEWDKEGKEK